jgi:hypothetical protein
MTTGQRFVQQHADRPDVSPGRGGLAVKPFRRDVRERPRDIARGSQRVRLREPRETKVEQADRDVVPVREEDVRGLDVSVHDPARVRVRQAFEHLRGGLDDLVVAQLTSAQCLPHGPSRDVLVRDVDVLRVPAAGERAQAGRVLQRGHGLRLAARARPGLALARHDLDHQAAAVAFVLGEPNRPRTAAPEGLQRAVPAEEKGVEILCWGGPGHVRPPFSTV